MNYSQADSEDVDSQWEDMYEQAQDHAERLMADLIGKLHEAIETHDWYWYKHSLQELQDVSRMLETGDMFSYGERFIADLSDNGDY